MEEETLLREYDAIPTKTTLLPSSIQDLHPVPKLRRHFCDTSPRWMGPGFGVSLVALLVTVITIIILAALLANADQQATANNIIEPTGKCGTSFTPTNSTYRAQLHAETRKKLISTILRNVSSNGLIYLEGAVRTMRQGSDVDLPFRQESNFIYVTGVTDMPNCTVVVDLRNGKTVLFVPKPTLQTAIYDGVPLSLAQIQQLYGIDEVYYRDNFTTVISDLTKDVVDNHAFVVYTLQGVAFPFNRTFTINSTALAVAMRTSRETKTEAELNMMRISIAVSSGAHESVMKLVNRELYEYSVASQFISYCYACSLQYQSYNPIVGAGYNSAILHYMANTELLNWRQDHGDGKNNLMLIDAAGEYYGYGADITRTYPISGKYTEDQTKVYNIVLKAQTTAISMIKPGVKWKAMSNAVTQVICHGLQDLKLIVASLNCTNVTEVSAVVKVFLPHGLGHHVGLDVHDSVIFPDVLAPGMVVAVEPGIYFNEVGIGQALGNPKLAQFLVESEINRYLAMEMGGIRIEDDVLVTADGFEILSTPPRTIQDVEKLMQH